ncbi:MAG: hypothetical protein AABZ19_02145 [Pseudomonadota bacterium]
MRIAFIGLGHHLRVFDLSAEAVQGLVNLNPQQVQAATSPTEAARQVHQPLPLGAQALQLYELWSRQGHGQLDFSSIIQLLQGQRPA